MEDSALVKSTTQNFYIYSLKSASPGLDLSDKTEHGIESCTVLCQHGELGA